MILLNLYLVSLYYYTSDYSVLYIAIFISLLIWILFGSLTVELTDDKINLWFWVWLIRKSFLLDEIESVKKVKNKWYYGWGIRIWFWPKMIIYNVSWYDAIELKMKNWKIFRIWTDDVDNLENLLTERIK